MKSYKYFQTKFLAIYMLMEEIALWRYQSTDGSEKDFHFSGALRGSNNIFQIVPQTT